MKTIIAGGRDYFFSLEDEAFLDSLPITEVVCGCAKGADTCGEEWALERGLPVKRFPAKWDKFGLGAGHIRNRQMALYAEVVVLFPGGKGTASMHKTAKELGLTIHKMKETEK